MKIEIQKIPASKLGEYAAIPIRFQVRSKYQVEQFMEGVGGLLMREVKVVPPYVKDYDAGETPLDWPEKFDVANWGIFLAKEGGRNVGAAAVALNTPEVNLLEGRQDLAVLWDIRVRPDVRGTGIGTALFRHAAAWARSKGCRQMKIETQNVNVLACRFYIRMGCELGMVHRFGYAAIPAVEDEAMLFWYLRLD
ncbi:MAG: GNAT family N-acetyltransferase [Anaerolineaceae bacterium]|jgi:GNAT superfamily N-acetyltransferase